MSFVIAASSCGARWGTRPESRRNVPIARSPLRRSSRVADRRSSRSRSGSRARRSSACRGGRSIPTAAPAKLNLALAVVGRRADGYHDLWSVFARLDLADDVRVAPNKKLEVRNTLDIGAGEDLAARAVRVLAGATAREAHAFVRIRKRIPLAAGLGGGSSDAAATMRALAALWGVEVDLVRIAADVGSDVPFFAANVAVALVSGRCEIVEPLPAPREPLHVVVLRPPVRLRTAEVFAALEAKEMGHFEHVEGLARAFRAR